MMSEGTTDAIFSLESEAGNSPCSSPGGKGRAGQAPAPASRSASPARAPGKRTSDTCGPLFTASSPSADLQSMFGEQVASPDGLQWLAGVRLDLEGSGYAVGAADLPAASVGAPHIRQRLWWVADSDQSGLHEHKIDSRSVEHLEIERKLQRSPGRSTDSRLADSASRSRCETSRIAPGREPDPCLEGLGNATGDDEQWQRQPGASCGRQGSARGSGARVAYSRCGVRTHARVAGIESGRNVWRKGISWRWPIRLR